ncbi:hypothetical protein F3Y22_tig00116975pilonHSYRG00198 [Hibiscus syriacus]|uniref:Uncharacterized protein n=1 Tax=Hibiscus syriacus TaxID=106335 RepID=A0A6A2WTG5_HIBSY|nr:hypothetical protein F3Y22_tig00116975pilonHSYRG00198 [Hibiscus syriacus]
MVEGIVLTSPALPVKPIHPPNCANKSGIPVSRDPAALLTKYSDPLVYPVRQSHRSTCLPGFIQRSSLQVERHKALRWLLARPSVRAGERGDRAIHRMEKRLDGSY